MGMKAMDFLKQINFEKLSKADKASLKKRILEQKKDLQKRLQDLDVSLDRLSREPTIKSSGEAKSRGTKK
jgi:hypothetical protein